MRVESLRSRALIVLINKIDEVQKAERKARTEAMHHEVFDTTKLHFV